MEFNTIKEVISKVKDIDKESIKEETRFIEDLHCDSYRENQKCKMIIILLN